MCKRKEQEQYKMRVVTRSSKLLVVLCIFVAGAIIFGIYRERSNNLPTVKKQIEIFAENVDEWSNVTGYFCFTVADLNKDGKLELIISTIQGSGSYAYTQYYVIDDKKQELITLYQEDKEKYYPSLIHDFLIGTQVSDDTYRTVVDGIIYVPVYYDKQTNLYYYIHHDYSGHTPYEAYDRIISQVLEGDQIKQSLLAYKKTTRVSSEDINSLTSYKDNNQNEISEGQYKQIDEYAYDKCIEMQMCWQWKKIENSKEVQKMKKSELKNILWEMYNNFIIEEKMGG